MRKKISFTQDIAETVAQLSEGNPGALTFLLDTLKSKSPESVFVFILNLDDMNIRGSQIWLGYKHYCKFDSNKFIKLVNNRDSNLVHFINQESEKDGLEEKARTHGASFVYESMDKDFIEDLMSK